MAQKGYVDNWSKRPHGERKQAQAISYILDRKDYFESIGYIVPISRIFVECEEAISVCRSTIRQWWIHFGQYGELPYETKEHFKKIRKNHAGCLSDLPSTRMANDWEVVHFRALRCVKKDQGIKYYRRCGVIAANHVTTTKEQEDEEMEQMVMIIISFNYLNPN